VFVAEIEKSPHDNKIDIVSSPDLRHMMTDITLRPVSKGLSIIAAVIEADSDLFIFSHSKPAALIQSTLGCVGKVESVKIKLLDSAGSWLLTGFLHNVCDVSEHPTRQDRDVPQSRVRSSSLWARARALGIRNTDIDVIGSKQTNAARAMLILAIMIAMINHQPFGRIFDGIQSRAAPVGMEEGG
jgi:hypothetical protein